jgi:acetyl-CoA carboxylase biotin carboxyl carrier protein
LWRFLIELTAESYLMAENAPSSTPFDLDRIRELVEMMEAHGVTEVRLQRGDERWTLRRGGGMMQMVPAGAFPTMPAANPAPAAAAEPKAAEPAEKLLVIKSPTVGTFYSAPSPDEPAFVNIGSRVEHDTVVCIVEAMKVFNQIPAEVSGTIVEVLVSSGDAVEFGQPLFRVRPG